MEMSRKLIWVRIGEYATVSPFETYGEISIEKSDPVIKECLQKYKQGFIDKDIPIEEPVQVAVRRLAKEGEEHYYEDMFGRKIKDIKINYTLGEL